MSVADDIFALLISESLVHGTHQYVCWTDLSSCILTIKNLSVPGKKIRNSFINHISSSWQERGAEVCSRLPRNKRAKFYVRGRTKWVREVLTDCWYLDSIYLLVWQNCSEKKKVIMHNNYLLRYADSFGVLLLKRQNLSKSNSDILMVRGERK